MSRLIKEDVAIERISNAIWHLPNDMYPRFNNFDTIHAVVKDAVKGVPTAQPGEIIRCKDCDWWEKQEDSLQGRCALMQMYPTGAWYCGNARRRNHEP